MRRWHGITSVYQTHEGRWPGNAWRGPVVGSGLLSAPSWFCVVRILRAVVKDCESWRHSGRALACSFVMRIVFLIPYKHCWDNEHIECHEGIVCLIECDFADADNIIVVRIFLLLLFIWVSWGYSVGVLTIFVFGDGPSLGDLTISIRHVPQGRSLIWLILLCRLCRERRVAFAMRCHSIVNGEPQLN
jgi:hypothetical protein